jgi:undecaprenyl pyrophosphate phosphatase UppP
MSQTPSETAEKRKIVLAIAIGIVAWGIVLAIGDYYANRDLRRPLIIMAGVVLFVGFWLAMLRFRRSDQTPKWPD